MAIRNIREIGDNVLTKVSREIKTVDKRIKVLIDDMLDTLYDAEGVGLAAPQIGILKRLVVIDVSEEGNDPIILINPEILEVDGSQVGNEGCLSVPGKVGTVERPNYVKVKAYDKNMEEFILEGTELLARALCHEIDHLNGILYVDKAIDGVRDLYEEVEEE
ncbi:MAG: peptide deformylase [Clostridiales bacterium]|nr:peptide deformylase [Bacillota bacterium]NLK04306.1 peptide deformylase [Clostridiales bacterium]